MTRRTRLAIEALDDRCLPSFSPAVNYGVSPNPRAVATADFNNDEVLDLAVASESRSEMRVLLGNPDGTFQPALDLRHRQRGPTEVPRGRRLQRRRPSTSRPATATITAMGPSM